MIPGNAEIVKCPYCGTEKMLMTLISGNTCGAEYWSDNKRIAPMLPSVSPVQKCPDVLESIPYDLLQDFERTIYDDIKKRVENIDNKVFKLTL